MKKIYFLYLIFIYSGLFGQADSYFGNISDLVFRKENIRIPQENDTLEGRLMNFHYVKDTLQTPYLYNTQSRLRQLSVFFVGNKIGGEEKIILGQTGSSIITNKGVFDYGDTLLVDAPTESPRIITYSKRDRTKSPYIFLSPIQRKDVLIPDFLVFKRDLSPNEKQRIETYLSIKYGISINYISEKNYLSSASDVIWNFKDNKKYGYRITGIGRDDAFELYQKQSTNSQNDLVTFSLSDIKLLNSENEGTLNNNEFLLWGDNNEDVEFPDEDLLSYQSKGDLLRIWKVQTKSESGLQTNVYFKPSADVYSSGLPKLKLFRSTENLQSDIAEFVAAESVNDSVFVFKNVDWDTDNNGFDYFTLNNSDANSDISIVSDCNELQNGLVKINVPEEMLPVNYSLYDLNNQTEIYTNQVSSSNPITFSELEPSKYQINIHRDNEQSDIVRTFDMQGISNQNIQDNYLWEGNPIELDINYENYQYSLTKPNGNIVNHAPYMLDGLGDYILTVKNKIGCEIQKNLHVLNEQDFNNQNQSSLFSSIQLYPNPSHDGIITVKIQLKSPRPVTIQIYNSLGRLLKDASYNNTDSVTSTLSIPAMTGYYNVKIFIPEESKSYNLIIN
ncbi:MAG: T9SS type A sorting domain-containing protein [Flavobacteriaceae bacterium]|jgi:hypothetical protein|nr:T9SS type A sorting domain-containing protein [Flavobacteriaceae bacterium]